MRRISSLLIALTALTFAPMASAADELPPPWTVLGWGDAPGEPGLLPGGGERPAVGPIALAVDGDKLIISDRVHRQLLVVGTTGRVTDVIPTGFVAVDLQSLEPGRLVALDVMGDRVHLLDGPGVWRPVVFGARAALSTVAVGPRGNAWAVDRLGRGNVLGATNTHTSTLFERATPLGRGVDFHGTGRRVDAQHGEVLLWRWSRSAEVKPPGADLRLPISVDGRLLGALRPLTVDRAGVVHVLVETLAAGPQVAVRAEVRRFATDDGGRELGRTTWPIRNVAPVNRYAAVGPDGTLFVMAALPEGLALWRLPSQAPAGGAR